MINNFVKKMLLFIFFVLFAANSIFAQTENNSASTNWSGHYLGLSIGASSAKTKPNTKIIGSDYFITTDFGQIEPLSSKNLSGLDFNASIFYGINWQLSSFVLGFEVDFSLINYDEKYSSGNIYYITQPTEPFSVTTNVKSRWIASIRPRLGYSWKSSLFYFTGGLAVTKLKYEFTFKDNFVGGHYANASSNKVLIGWTIGLGWEIKLSEKMGLALKTEYLYYNFQNQITENSKLSNTSTSFSHTVGFYVHSFRVGLTKLF